MCCKYVWASSFYIWLRSVCCEQFKHWTNFCIGNLKIEETAGSKTYEAFFWAFRTRTNLLTKLSCCAAPFLFPLVSFPVKNSHHDTARHSTIQFAAIVLDLWVNTPAPTPCKDSRWLNLYLTHIVDIFLEEKLFYFKFIFWHFVCVCVALLETYVCVYIFSAYIFKE